ncbi:TolB family protein [Wenxinia marina]|uniref:Periplasmic component of the Tol biopolymer transport system n=1 Tax=Wenxinia marina DSM 24838 TaxID=1123501 RepID=A0A0D0Q6D3_9RHOB|nr:TolB family protein [Wenxinia marina]KIQ70024.1 Periplasmic component of the Tol biopolymer transport system [Wenxinia marina DSM 24838]GGL62923.1 hypothetical protein GCM10011392_16990 [Wenxinia marina]
MTDPRSTLAILDPATGAEEVVLQTDRLIEAPNWTPDGAALIVNGDGLIWRVPLAEPRLVPVDTAFADRCNNDHGLSPDGRTLVISHHTGGKSCIYTLPVEGGTPVRVTANMPSWWHGWSPDGARLAYTAVRDEEFGIWTCPVSGGDETRVISGPHHYDGPDYTPDGDWIWFNSTRGGTMDLWRVRPDGSDAEQMTHDGSDNWFPHPSPAGGEILYLAYEGGTEGHPRDREVELRMLDPRTGGTRTILSFFGGQGSINVPCWHPDGRRFAFVRYGRP